MKTKTARKIHQADPVAGTRANPSERLMRQAGTDQAKLARLRPPVARGAKRPGPAGRTGR